MLKKFGIMILTFVLLCILTTVAFAWENSITVGIDLPGTHELSGNVSGYNINIDTDTDPGFSFGYEGAYKFSNQMKLGIGYELQLNRSLDNNAGDFKFYSYYVFANFPLSNNNLKPYIITRLGYGLINGDSEYKGGATLDDGSYYAAGIGIKPYEKIDFNLLYSVNNGSGEYFGYKGDIEYSKFSVVAKYDF